jgi:hypothetical protein
MTFFKRMMFLHIFLLILGAAVLWVSCDTGSSPYVPYTPGSAPGLYVNDTAENVTVSFSEGASYSYPAGTLDVDYNAANNAVFFSFDDGSGSATTTTLGHDFFDIAIDADGTVIANSGSYGSGVQVYDTGAADITGNYSTLQSRVKEYTFKPTLHTGRLYGYQSKANPLEPLDTTTSNVYLIKVQYGNATAAYFKVTFGMTMTGGPPSFDVTVVPGLGGGDSGKVTVKAGVSSLTANYGWLYFKLVGTGGPRVLNNGTTWTGSGTAVPKAKGGWDILAIRTDELQTENGTTVSAQMPVANRSSVLLNTYGGVKAGVISGKYIDEAQGSFTVGMRSAVDTIGYGWYTMTGMPPVFSMAKNTYVITTSGGKTVKFQPETFYNSNSSKSFYMEFSYYVSP